MSLATLRNFYLDGDVFGAGTLGNLQKFQQHMNRLFNDSNALTDNGLYPAVNISASEETATLTSEMPGMELSDIDISVTGKILSLSGKRNNENLKENERYLKQERSFGEFSRRIQLPFSVDGDKVTATYKRGILTVVLPRAEAEKAKKIAVR